MDKFKEFLGNFSHSEFPNVHKMGRSYYLADEELWNMKEQLKKDVFSVGIFLGEDKGRFEPSPALLDIISKFPDSEKRKVYVNKKAEWLFLCGRNVLSNSISRNPHGLNSGLVLVQNENDENLGFGIFKEEGNNRKEIILRNLLDKGNYLRMEDKKGKKKRR